MTEQLDQAQCNHGIVFDEEAALKLNADHTYVRRRWPRLCGKCPLGCGYNGIFYASKAHFVWGDW